MKSVIKADKEKQISAIDKRLYSSFIEHLGRAVYHGSMSRDMRLPMIWDFARMFLRLSVR